MRHEIKKKLIELDLRSYELSKELEKAKGIEIDDADLAGLRKKAGDRAIVIARNALVEDIREDIKEVEDETIEDMPMDTKITQLICLLQHPVKKVVYDELHKTTTAT